MNARLGLQFFHIMCINQTEQALYIQLEEAEVEEQESVVKQHLTAIYKS